MARTIGVILLESVPGLGEAGTEHSVATAYAQRILIPRGLATPANERVRATVAAGVAKRVALAEQRLTAARGALQRIAGRTLVIPAKASKNSLYGSIGAEAIAGAAKAGFGADLDPTWIELAAPITTVGDHRITVRVPDVPPVTATVTVTAA